MWGIVPAAGRGTRIQPLAFSKELLPVSDRRDGTTRQPRAVSDYLVERLVLAGADKICFVIAPGKSDILEYYGGVVRSASICYVVQPTPAGLCDSVFRAIPVIDPHEPVIVGLPDTVWFPSDALQCLPDDRLSLLLFPVDQPEHFDAVAIDRENRVLAIEVKQPAPTSRWIWGAIKMPGSLLHELYALWCGRGRLDEYLGTLINAWIANGGAAYGYSLGTRYFDVGTMDGYIDLMRVLRETGGEIESMPAGEWN